MAFLLLLAACETPGDTGAPVAGDSCTALTSGRWTVTGPAWGMADNPMDGDVTMDAESCTFAFSNWDMQMDDLPSGGVLDGDAVQLDGLTDYWRSCTGTAADEGNVSGTCAEDGADFQMVAAG
jgi:hypothetical protein